MITTNGDATKVCASTMATNDRVNGTPASTASPPIRLLGPKTVSSNIPLTMGGNTSGTTTSAVTARVQGCSVRARAYARGTPKRSDTTAVPVAVPNDTEAACVTSVSPRRAITCAGGSATNSAPSGTK